MIEFIAYAQNILSLILHNSLISIAVALFSSDVVLQVKYE